MSRRHRRAGTASQTHNIFDKFVSCMQGGLPMLASVVLHA